MNQRDKVKSVYKLLVEMFLRTDDDVTYWKSQKIIEEFPSLFPEINFDELKNEINGELFNRDTNHNEAILGYRYGNLPEIHDSLPDYDKEIVVVYKDEEIVVVYKNGTTRSYDYFGGELTRPRC